MYWQTTQGIALVPVQYGGFTEEITMILFTSTRWFELVVKVCRMYYVLR